MKIATSKWSNRVFGLTFSHAAIHLLIGRRTIRFAWGIE